MLHERGMGIVQDIVPNHMSIGDAANQWWNDVLENGPSSPYADFFDIDWNPPKHDLANKILLPVLGEQYGKVLENKEIQIAYDNGSGTFQARYFEHSFPLAPRSLQWILKPALRALTQKLGDSDPDVLELESILNAVEHLPGAHRNRPEEGSRAAARDPGHQAPDLGPLREERRRPRCDRGLAGGSQRHQG